MRLFASAVDNNLMVSNIFLGEFQIWGGKQPLPACCPYSTEPSKPSSNFFEEDSITFLSKNIAITICQPEAWNRAEYTPLLQISAPKSLHTSSFWELRKLINSYCLIFLIFWFLQENLLSATTCILLANFLQPWVSLHRLRLLLKLFQPVFTCWACPAMPPQSSVGPQCYLPRIP